MKSPALLAALVFCVFTPGASAQSVKPATNEPANPDLMFRAKVIEKKGTANEFTLRLQREDGSVMESSHTKYSFNSAPADPSLFDLLEVGKAYDFPKSISADPRHRGLGEATEPRLFMVVFDHCPVTIDARLFQREQTGDSIVGLKYCSPFRAKVVAKSVTQDSVSITLLRTDGQQSTLVQQGSFGLGVTVAVVDRLDEGGFYEFPHVFSTTRADPPRDVQPATPEMKALSKWIGQWQNVHDKDPQRKEFQKFTWKADGKGIWRETMIGSPGSHFNMVCASLITYDDEKKTYLETRTSPATKLVMTRTWDAANQSFKGRIELPDGKGKALDSSATFSGDDRIDWKSEFTLPGKDKTQTLTGHYERM